jgi:two-component system, LytTR family, sensor kinase
VDGTLKGAGMRVPPMLVQPFIENAIWHGLRHKEGKGLLSVAVEDTPGSVRFTITDDGIGRTRAAAIRASHAKPSKGIDNTRNRIALVNTLYRGSLTLAVEDLHADGSGTRVRFDIPKDLAHGH